MTGTLPPWPAHGEFLWDAKVMPRLDAVATTAAATADRVDDHEVAITTVEGKLGVVDAGGNVGPVLGGVLTLYSPDGSLWKISINNSGVLAQTKVDAANPLPGTNPMPGADPEDVPDTVAIGAHTFALAGINRPRAAKELIQYTATSPTTTNQYGVEVVVRKSDSHVVRVNDRIAAGAVGGTTFDPPTEYVLSGHGDTDATWGGAFLRSWATVGATVVLSSTATPAPTPPVPNNDPSKRVVVWHHGWNALRVYTGYPAGVQTTIDRVVLAMAQSAGAGTGTLNYTGITTNLASDITAAKAAGVDVLMGIGGSADGGITVVTNTQADQMVASITGFVTSLGINGISFDLEDVSRWNSASIVRVAQAVKQKYGTGFLVDVTAGYYYPQDAQYNQLAVALGANMDTFSTMEYDYPEASQTNYGSMVAGKVGRMVTAGVPLTKIVFGQAVRDPSNPTYTGYTANVADARTAYQTVKAAYPTIGGAFIWEDKISAARSWDWVLGMAATVHA